MSDTKKRELVIIGAGPGGYAAAFRAADLGLKVTLIDSEPKPGGVCLYRGCIPSKALLHVAKIKQEAEEVKNWGLAFDNPKIDLEKLRTFKDKTIKTLTDGLAQLSKNKDIEYIQAKAEFASEEKIVIHLEDGDKYTLQYENLILATGSTNIDLPDIELDHKTVIGSTDALELPKIPEKMLVIGGGYIGMEMGSVYANLGAKISVAEMTENLLPNTDQDLVKVFEKEHAFAEVLLEHKIEKVSVENEKAKVLLKNKDDEEKEKEFDLVLVAIGRKPNTSSLKLEKANIAIDEDGFIKVNKKLQTNQKHIYAIGDITPGPMLAHKASHQARIAAEVIADKQSAAYDVRSIPAIVFTNPEIAWCGLTEIEAKEKNTNYKVLKFPWSASGRARAIGTANGLTKLLIEPDSGRILGGGVAGKNAGSLIPEISLAIEMGATAEDLALSIHPHPTLSETIMEAAEIYMGGATHIGKK
ncbi:dihydrolipoyl dehydrogenase [Marixanthomonas spongiae]|uniref:Dihydrolipoyl dehydrogenase n=1 Tax=Marixanthomonas spongiae TaxID=2174845 RepID=A0A2U0HSL0_9FLAO|nr:dihydrolipoyl dehydrogenase [Marixanthomonas spongiae]PVW11819.1 dihydrolipoyl dehydrogenase [Marixanthomonas spongiae]